MTDQADILIKQLEQASKRSTPGEKSWDEFDASGMLAELYDTEDNDVKKIIRSKYICYLIASGKVDINPKLAAEVLPRIEKLLHSDMFPTKIGFTSLIDWVEQVTFLFDMIRPQDQKSKPMPSELMEQNLGILRDLIGLCYSRQSYKMINRTERDWSVFEKICRIAKLGLSPEYQFETNLCALELVNQLANLIGKSQFVATIGKEHFDLISGQLWLIVKDNMRELAIKCRQCDKKLSADIYKWILGAIELLPASDEALEFFYSNLGKKSQPESEAVDLALLNSMLIKKNYEAKGIWPILDVHLSKKDPNIRNECLKIARGLFGREGTNKDGFKLLLKHIDAIIRDIASSLSKTNQATVSNVSELLCSLALTDKSIRNRIQIRLARLLKETPFEYLDGNVIGPMIKAISAKHPAPLDANLLRKVAIDKFRNIYQSGFDIKDDKALKALHLLIATEGDESTSQRLKYIHIVASGCRGIAPKGCNKAVFTLLKRSRALVKDGNEICLLPLAQAVYYQRDLLPGTIPDTI